VNTGNVKLKLVDPEHDEPNGVVFAAAVTGNAITAPLQTF
jgi:hypothetical protein